MIAFDGHVRLIFSNSLVQCIVISNSWCEIFIFLREISSQLFFGFKPDADSTQCGEGRSVKNGNGMGKEVNGTTVVSSSKAGPSRMCG